MSTQVQNPGPFRLTPGLKTLFGVFAIVGFVSTVAAIFLEPHHAWPSFLVNYFFFLMMGLFGAFFVALQHITNAYWSVTVRRVAEGVMMYLPVAFVLGAVLLFGSHHLYEWTHTEVVMADKILKGKTSYLNLPFFTIRLFGFIGLWTIVAMKFRKNSLRQDEDGEHSHTLSSIKLSAFFLPFFGISFTLLSFDLLMSLEPHWFSTIFGVYCFAGLFGGGLSLLALLVLYARNQGLFSEQLVNDNHVHDIAKLMFGFTVFWGYIMFSQLMLIWYANIPEETPYYLLRFNDGWWSYSIFLFFIHFMVPFFGLLPRRAKRSARYLKWMALILISSVWFDVYYMVMPVFFKSGPVIGWVEIGTFLGFLGLFVLTVSHFLSKAPAVPLKDPRVQDCLAHHQFPV